MKCKICGAESGPYPLCSKCHTKRVAGEIIKCQKCRSWHYANVSCLADESCTEEGGPNSQTGSNRDTANGSEPDEAFLYEVKPSLVTKTEMAYLNYIRSILPENCRIQPQANLASFISRTDGAKYQNELFRNVDFIVTDLAYRPLFVIEINDQTHLAPDRRERDRKVNNICEEAGIPLIKFWTSYGVNETYIKRKIMETLSSLPSRRVHHFTRLHEEKSTAESIPKENEFTQEAAAAGERPQIPAPSSTELWPTPKKEGCYIATCIYGSYDCPQVWTLRRFRDEWLKKSPGGRILIKIYYAVSPALIRGLGKSEPVERLCRSCLDLLVRCLQNTGISSEPYEDPRDMN